MKLLFCMADPEPANNIDGHHFPPRYFRPWKASTILNEVIQKVVGTGVFSEIYLVAHVGHRAFQPHLAAIMAQYSIPVSNLIFIPPSKGQADSAFRACQKISEVSSEGPIFIHNVDTILLGRDFHRIAKLLSAADGFIDSFQAYNPDYSYILSNAEGIVQNIAEKSVISNLATSGFYGFTSVNQYLSYFQKTKFASNYYISTIYSTLISEGKKIRTINEADNYRTIVLDSEEEYRTNSLLMSTF